jgi:hypothetical protein
LPKDKSTYSTFVAAKAVSFCDSIYYGEKQLADLTATERYEQRLVKVKPLLDAFEHLAILHVIYLHIFRHLAQKSFDRQQPACMIFAQSDKKYDGASDAGSLCGVALTFDVGCKKTVNEFP